MKLIEANGRIEATATYEEREVLKGARFRWDGTAKKWWTLDLGCAALLAEYAEGDLKVKLGAADTQRKLTLEASRARDAQVDLLVPEGLAYLPYQKAGIAFALNREAVLIGDEMGLGKTIQAIGIINADPTVRRVLVICPASLKLNWKREMTKWLVKPANIGIASGSEWPLTEMVIINFDVVKKHHDALRATPWDLIIMDEAHKLKNPKSQRTQFTLGSKNRKGEQEIAAIPARRRVMLTGTPITNRPIELWPLVSYLDPTTFSNFFQFAIRFCGANQASGHWDFSGSSNLPELNDLLRGSVMIRRLKSEVLTELPAKRRQVIEIPANGCSGAVKAEKLAWEAQEARLAQIRAMVELAKAAEDDAAYTTAVARLRDAVQVAFTEIARLRHETALAKAPYVADHLIDTLEAGEGKVVVFAHHLDVIQILMDRLAEEGIGVVRLTGQDSMENRQVSVDRFQTDPNVRVFIGGIHAAGVGITLTAASHVIFAELDWVPGNITQCEDRTHRIGQVNPVLIQHLVLEDSLDCRMAKVLVEKQAVIDMALDAEVEATVPALPSVPKTTGATTGSTRKQLAAEAGNMTTAQVEATHTALRILAGLDGDHAMEQNGIGYNGLDSTIGHSLANCATLSFRQAALGRKIIRKYHRQLGAELLFQAGCSVAQPTT